jgi:formylglycine-generating enzyme required for sulfatase activity
VNSGSITDNAAWKPLERVDSFGVTQVLVPAGCFMMGSDESEYPDVQPAHKQCITVAFWLDKTETTRAQYAQCVLAGACQPRTPDTASNSDEQPINNLTWEQARAYCLWRASSLPSEPQWEYAARGPSNLLYPWGADFVSDNVVWQSNSVRKSAAVGSRPEGVSWVGALDMLGNIGEWTNSLYAPYPYVREDGREVTSAEGQRVVRGGTFEDSRRFISTLFRKPFEANSSSTFYGVRCVTLVN